MVKPYEQWVEEQVKLAQPDKVVWCDGSEEEARRLIKVGIEEEKLNGKPVFSELNQKEWPNSYLHYSHPQDVARTEHLTYVCYPDKEDAGSNNNWMSPEDGKGKMTELSKGCMKGRTMYVMPYTMGDANSPYAKPCVQVTDSSYVAVSMRIMTRMGKAALDMIGDSDDFIKGFHSIGDLNPERRLIMHFPNDKLIWSVGSGYGGNALLGKKCLALRLASAMGKTQGWLAEHMVILGLEDPKGKVTYITAALPSACGKTNLAMLESALPGYKIWTIGDDIAWLNIGPDGRLWAINPEAGYFGVAPGTAMNTNPNMIKTLKKDKFYPTLFTNVARNKDTNEPWWEGLDGEVPKNLQDWQGNDWDPASGKKAAHPNSRFTVSIANTPTLSPELENPKGVPISAIIFGARRTKLIPLVTESFDWENGVFLGARMGSETTAAAAHQVGVLRRDPMAMLPFCGYNMGDYFGHWCEMGKKIKNAPKIFNVNWFRTDQDGKFIWPGFGENIRVLKWIVDRVNGEVDAKETPAGLVPNVKDLDLSGLDIPEDKLNQLFDINMKEWDAEVKDIHEFLSKFGDRMPKAMWDQFKKLEKASKNS